MVISDKQELRRCVKQLVRRAGVCEAELSFDVVQGECGVEAMLDTWARPAGTASESLRRSCADQTPFSADACAMFAALNALDFPVRDLDRAVSMERSYNRSAYLRELLDVMRAKCVLVRVPLNQAEHAQFDDDRFHALLAIDSHLFAPGRYGVDYALAARRIGEAAAACAAKNIRLDHFDEQALEYCVLPACQDHALALHVHVKNEEELDRFTQLLDRFDGVHALISGEEDVQRALLCAAQRRVRMMVRLSDPAHVEEALRLLGTTRIVPFAACAPLPEIMLGRWIGAKEAIWQALADAYLPLARAGYELQSAAIERDINRLMHGNLMALCGVNQEI